jgi:acetyl-CoA carboxylase biotin carboxyl carrier protein
MSNENDSKLPDLSYIRELAGIFQDHELDELEIETGETRMLLRRADMPVVTQAAAPVAAPVAVAAAAPAAAPSAAPAQLPGDFITSPFVGTFYAAPRPDAASFVEVGSKVQPGATVCIVEAMKLFNEIEADFACTIEEVLVEAGQPVEYGAKLFRVTKQ